MLLFTIYINLHKDSLHHHNNNNNKKKLKKLLLSETMDTANTNKLEKKKTSFSLVFCDRKKMTKISFTRL